MSVCDNKSGPLQNGTPIADMVLKSSGVSVTSFTDEAKRERYPYWNTTVPRITERQI